MNAGDGCGCIFGIILVAAWTFDIHPIVGCIATIACICFAVWAMENTTPPPKTSTIIKNNNAQPKGNTQADSPLRLSITKNLCPTKNVNSEDFRHLLISHGIKYFYHFVTLSIDALSCEMCLIILKQIIYISTYYNVEKKFIYVYIIKLL